MGHRLLVVMATLSAIACGRGAAAERPVAPPTTHTVVIETMRYQPESLALKAGDSVVWINKDLFPHTVTSPAVGVDSKDIAAGASWTHTFAAAGDVAYACTYHPTMKGTVTVR